MNEVFAKLEVTDPEIATRLWQGCVGASACISEALSDVHPRLQEDQRKNVVLAVGWVLGGELLDFMNMLQKQHPQLEALDQSECAKIGRGLDA